ncbi:VOC family protein [Ruegeria profundi]|uniref:VOC domain-containing protein n=1 Tax=Ruegeria profundi TaxID=1685378 RepID=A0A0X3TU77_9RHOB|nr:VOC family protein [Ruegeria profundi]KUJ79249.1 hypothetical protein AVO44_08405 [Ruegeria profundi]
MNKSDISQLFYNDMSRRAFLGALAAVGVAPRAIAQGKPAPVNLGAINHTVIHASDPMRSVEWYQGLFGMPIVGDFEDRVNLRVGDGPAYLTIMKEATDSPRWGEVGLALDPVDPLVPGDPEGFAEILKQHGMEQSDDPGPGEFSLTMRGPESGGAEGGTPVLMIVDPFGLKYSLTHKLNCGGGGPLGTECRLSYPVESQFKTVEINHATLGITDTDKGKEFYQTLFDMPIRAYQGDTTPVYTVSGYSTIVLFDFSNDTNFQGMDPQMDHTCYSIEDYDFNLVRAKLSEYGLEDLGDVFRASGPLQHYHTSRRPDRGGAPGGSYEIYCTDPDNLVIQIQDVTYCGGGGTNGEICGTAENPSR